MTFAVDYKFVFRENPDPVVLLDKHFNILDANEVYLKTVSKSRDELVGKNLFVVFPTSEESDRTEGVLEHLKSIVKTKKKLSTKIFRYDIISESGKPETKFWKTYSFPLLQNGEVQYIVHTAQDMTEVVRATQNIDPAENIFKLVLDNVRDYAIFLLDTEGRIRTWNVGAKKLNMYEATEIIGKHFSIFYSEEDIRSHKPEKELEIAEADGRVEDENWRKRKNGTYYWANVIITAIHDENGVLVGYAKIVRDLTERKINEENIILAYQESSKLKSEFLANMSHEIRTPMNGVMLAAALLEESTNLTKEQRELVSVIQSSGKSMVKLINDILDYSKIESDRVYIVHENFDLYKETEEIISNYEALIIKPVKLLLHIDEKVPRFIKGDRLRFHQVLSKIVDNGIKFTESGSVTVTLDTIKEEENEITVRFKVVDTGIGIKHEDIQKLFSPFSQLDNFSTKRYKGAGLGLAICKRVIELMKGEITISSEEGQGTTVVFTLAFKRNVERSKIRKEEGKNKINVSNLRALNPDVKVLVVEDNPVNQNVALRVLRRLGYKDIKLAENGEEAVSLFKETKYDVILMDIQMPVMDGYAATHAIRSLDAKVPIIAMTANAMKGDAEKCLAAGMNDYISKPIDIHLFASVLNHWTAEGK